MNTTSFIAAIALMLLPPPHQSKGEETSLTFDPEEGLVLSKAFKLELDTAVDEMTYSFGGEELPMEDPDINSRFRETIAVTDTYVEVSGSRPQELRRTFDLLLDIDECWGGSMQDTREESTSELEGLTVLFEWDDEEREYVVEFEESEADQSLLEGLEEDMDLRGFLPPAKVKEGDSWKLDAPAIDRLLTFGGDLKIGADAEAEEDAVDRAIEHAFENLDGTITCTYTGDTEVDGRALATIEIEMSGEGSTEAEDGTGSVVTELELGGQLEWDVEAGHFVAFELEGEIGFEIAWEEEEGLSMAFSISGDISVSGETEKK